MSGICGIVRLDGKDVKKQEIQSMLDIMKNRGNDEESIWVNNHVGFGYKMLWTTHESLNEKQPLTSDDGNLVLMADARIDNRDELYVKLEINESNFSKLTDSEIILQSYQKWGENCSQHLIGDFAFIIYDIKRNKFVCIRDHMGIKPFYYYSTEEDFIFSSEIDPLFANFTIQKIPNIEEINNKLSSYSISYDKTLFKNIFRLPNAHILTIENKNIDVKRYWYPEKISVNMDMTIEEASLRFYELLKQAVDVRTRSAYPIGCELSGGLDSSSITTIATEIKGNEHIKSFSLRYGEMPCDESKYIDAVIEKLGIEGYSIDADQLDYKNIYTLDHQYQERPEWFVHGVELESLAEFELIQNTNVRVVLTGLGSDQLLNGDLVMLSDFLTNLQFSRLLSELKYFDFSKKLIKNKLIIPLIPESLKKILRYILRKPKRTSNDTSFKNFKTKMFHSQKVALNDIIGEHTVYMADRTPYQVSGKYNIEFRHPFYDKRLIEFCLTLPPYMKLEKGVRKIILREAMKKKLPKIVHQRTDKGEYTPVIKLYLKEMGSKKVLENSLIEKFLIMSKDELNLNYKKDPWSITGLESWLKFHFRKK